MEVKPAVIVISARGANYNMLVFSPPCEMLSLDVIVQRPTRWWYHFPSQAEQGCVSHSRLNMLERVEKKKGPQVEK